MTEEETSAVRAALEDTRRRIRRDQRHASEEVSRILGILGGGLGAPDYCVEELKRLCPPGSDIQRQFLVELGFAPEIYFQQRRFDFALHLVCESGVSVGLIAEALGFSKARKLSNWFRRRAGLAPKKLRATQQRGRAGARESTPHTRDSRGRTWHRVLLKCARPEEAALLIRALREAYPDAVRDEPAATEEIGR